MSEALIEEEVAEDSSRVAVTSEGRDLNKNRLKEYDDCGASKITELLNTLRRTSSFTVSSERKIRFVQDSGEAAFFRAIEQEDYEMCCLLMKRNSNIVFAKEAVSEMTTLHKAAFFNSDPQICKLLVDNGAKKFIEAKDLLGKTPIQKAVLQGNVGLLLFFIQAEAQYNGKQLLQIAARKGHVRIIKTLLGLGMDINDYNDPNEYTALHYAVEKGNVEVIVLLMALNAAFDIKNREGKVAVDLTSDVRILQLLKLFLDYPSVKQYVLQNAVLIEKYEDMVSQGGEEEKNVITKETRVIQREYDDLYKDFAVFSEKSKKQIAQFKKAQAKWDKVFQEKEKAIAEKDEIIEEKENEIHQKQLDIERVEREVELSVTRYGNSKENYESEVQQKLVEMEEAHKVKFVLLTNEVTSRNKIIREEQDEILQKLEIELFDLKNKSDKGGNDIYTEEGLGKLIAEESEGTAAIKEDQKKFEQEIVELENEYKSVDSGKEKEKVLNLQKKIAETLAQIEEQKTLHKEEVVELEKVYEGQIQELAEQVKSLEGAEEKEEM